MLTRWATESAAPQWEHHNGKTRVRQPFYTTTPRKVSALNRNGKHPLLLSAENQVGGNIRELFEMAALRLFLIAASSAAAIAAVPEREWEGGATVT